MDATVKVLQNFELLQSILLHTGSYEILVATSVCTSWRAVVENSTALRNRIMSNSVFKTVWPEREALFRPMCYLNGTATDIWHFSVKTANNSRLFVYRNPGEDVEIYLLAPKQKDSHLKALDDAYDMYAVTDNFNPNLEFRTKSGEKVCRTKCKPFKSHPARHMWVQQRIGPIVSGDMLRNYLSTFYSDYYWPGVR